MSFILSPTEGRPRLLVINPNSTEAFTLSMKLALKCEFPIEFFTPSPATSPSGIEGSYDSVISASACLVELRDKLERWDGFIVACFSSHPLTFALRELSSAPVVSILSAPLLFASSLGSSVGILTTSPRWVPLLEHDIHSLHLIPLCSAGVVSSQLSVLDLHHLPPDLVLSRLVKIAKEELVEKRGADVIVLGCAGMVGLEEKIKENCGGVVVLDPVRCGLELCASLVRMRVGTSKIGIYAPAL